MRRTCRSSTAGFFSSPLAAALEQIVVRNAAPQEERQPRRQREIRQAVRGAGSDARRIGLDAQQELRTGEDAAQRHVDAAVEGAGLLAPAREEVEQHLQIGGAHVAAVGAPRKRLENLPRARCFVGERWPAGR